MGFLLLVLLVEEQHLDQTVNKNNGNLQIDNRKCRLNCMYLNNAEKGGSENRAHAKNCTSLYFGRRRNLPMTSMIFFRPISSLFS